MDDSGGHGTCVASKAAGWYNGISKNSKLVMMKASLKMADNTWAFAAALDDILEEGRSGKAVVVYPRSSIETYSRGSSELPADWSSIREIIQDLLAADVVVVTCAGNEATRRSSALDKVPAVWASKDFPLIVAGSVTNIGEVAKFSQGAETPNEVVWAPGYNVECAGASTQNQKRWGTSFSAGMVISPFHAKRERGGRVVC